MYHSQSTAIVETPQEKDVPTGKGRKPNESPDCTGLRRPRLADQWPTLTRSSVRRAALDKGE